MISSNSNLFKYGCIGRLKIVLLNFIDISKYLLINPNQPISREFTIINHHKEITLEVNIKFIQYNDKNNYLLLLRDSQGVGLSPWIRLIEF